MKRYGIMIDCSRNAVMKPDEVKNFAKIVKDMGYNMIQLYTEDTYEVENEPYFGYLRGRYSIDELKDIVSYCESIGMEVIPCIQTLAHLNQIFRWRAYVDVNDTADILLCEEERTYELIENMFKTLRKIYKTDIIHVGMDEAHLLGHGEYHRKHGYKRAFDIIRTHLEKVIELAKKYDFKPIMWSDMFFRLTNHGYYYPENPTITPEVKSAVPEGVGLVYWDYYHTDKNYFDKMMKAHFDLAPDVWFAGGARCWCGFVSGNQKTLDTMFPAMESVTDFGVENVLMTMWGDNGKECSFYSVLPSLYAVKKYYDGERDMDKIKRGFKEVTGEDYDKMMALDNPNNVAGNRENEKNASKYMLYSDPFLGYLDTTVIDGVGEEYRNYATQLLEYGKDSKYEYIFRTKSALCDVLELKYDLGVRSRSVYKSKNKDDLKALICDYDEVIRRLEIFHKAFKTLWFKENKPHGFDVQDIRLGGLKQRLISCKERLIELLEGKIDCIPELEEELLCYHGGGKEFKKVPAALNDWAKTVTPNVI